MSGSDQRSGGLSNTQQPPDSAYGDGLCDAMTVSKVPDALLKTVPGACAAVRSNASPRALSSGPTTLEVTLPAFGVPFSKISGSPCTGRLRGAV